MIAYTSGTTGDSKGAILTNLNMVSILARQTLYGYYYDPSDVYFSFIPLSHVYE